jgi:hypothetical protein
MRGFQAGNLWLALALAALVGCGGSKTPVYQDKQGFCFEPPAGWVERMREDALPARPGRKDDLPFPALGVPGSTSPERLLVRYDRLSAGKLAWVRISVAELPDTISLQDAVADRSPGPEWKRDGDVESLKIGTMPAARVAYVGSWSEQDYINESVALRHGTAVYFVSASFPKNDSAARDAVRKAIAGATWR